MCYSVPRLEGFLATVSPATKLKRQSAGSNYSKKYLTPEERVLRARNEYLNLYKQPTWQLHHYSFENNI